MADIYTPPPDSSYLLLTPFYMPIDSGTIWAIAFSNSSGTFVTAALSVIFTVIFACLWNLVCFIALSFPGSTTRRRYVALVTLWNSNDAWFAFRELASYSYHYFGKKSRGEFVYGVTFCLIAFVVYGGGLALGIVGPSLVQIGNVAPVRPSEVYYPSTPSSKDYPQILKEFGLRAPGVLRALGSVEAADVTVRRGVNFHYNSSFGTWTDGQPIHQFKYDYSISGVELGIQHGSSLRLKVEASCTTEYGWVVDNQGKDKDVYQLWGLPNQNFSIPIDVYDIQNAPKASFLSHPDANNQFKKDGNSSFAIVVWSAHRASISDSFDPWYATEARDSIVRAPFDAKFWIKRARPVLSCWQQDKWSYGAQTFNSVRDLRNEEGTKIPKVLRLVLDAAFTTPVLARLGNASGDSALRSRTTTPNGVIDAKASSIHDDIERLLVASYVATRNVFVDSTMFKWDDSQKQYNLMRTSDGQPADGAGDFVVASPNIQTFSLAGIIVLVVVLVALLLVELMIGWVIRHHHFNQESGNNRWIRFKSLSAVQLFRRIYYLGDDKTWSCDDHFPVQDDDTEFGLKGCRKSCKGHIESTKPETFR